MSDQESSTAAPLVARVFQQLGPGGFHSGAQLARQLGVSRNAIWKAVGVLKELGVAVHAVRNRGYRLAVPTAPLAPQRIRAGMDQSLQARVRTLEVAWQLQSTNSALFARSDLPPGRCDVLLAEVQLAGRGRRGRSWLATPGSALCLSLGWAMAQMPRDLGSLGLAVGVWVLQGLREHLAQGNTAGVPLKLKWPNDVLCSGRKLGGILIDLRAEAGGPSYAVIGIGLNIALDEAARTRIGATGTQPCDLLSLGVPPLQRNEIAASLIQCVLRGLAVFEHQGFKPFREEWQQADALQGRAVKVTTVQETTHGVARGIDIDGALLVETPNGLVRFVSGEVSVRAEE
ncbi:MAG TPA: biotin--[acetyl-CoA-carboxylase] ligase [Steroidobacteraceae bacterium]|nr:biotin--[acetyl-CoA-carboxylase] ligase [Steroidobacteraceae bacterium]